MAFHFVNNGRPTPGIPVLGRREPPISALLPPGLPTEGKARWTSPRWKAWDVPVVEVHLAFPFVEGMERPQVAMLKVLKLEARAFLKLECPVLAFHY